MTGQDVRDLQSRDDAPFFNLGLIYVFFLIGLGALRVLMIGVRNTDLYIILTLATILGYPDLPGVPAVLHVPAEERSQVSALPTLLALAALTAAAGCGLDAEGEPASKPPRPSERYTVERVVDGDTVELLSADGSTETVPRPGHRHAGDAREPQAGPATSSARPWTARRSEHSDQRRATTPRDSSPEAAPPGVEADGRDRYGRLVGYIEAADEFGQPFDFGGRMIADGYAHAYDGGRTLPPHPRED